MRRVLSLFSLGGEVGYEARSIPVLLRVEVGNEARPIRFSLGKRLVTRRVLRAFLREKGW